MKKFTLEIQMGNGAMLNAEDVAVALHGVAYEVEQSGEPGQIFDYNGNKVGTYTFGGEN